MIAADESIMSSKWPAEGAENRKRSVSLVSCYVGLTLVAGDMMVSRKVHGYIHEAGWHRDLIVPDRFQEESVRDFLLSVQDRILAESASAYSQDYECRQQ